MKPRLFQEIRHQSSKEKDDQFLYPDTVQVYIATNIKPKQCKILLKELGHFLPLMKVEDVKRLMSTQLDNDNANAKSSFEDRNNLVPLGHLRRVRRIQLPSSSSIENQDRIDIHTISNHEDNTSKVSFELSAAKVRKRKQETVHTQNENCEEEKVYLEILLGAVSQIDNIILHQSTTDENSKGQKLQNLINSYHLQLTKRTLPGRPARSQTEYMEWKNNDNWWPTLFFDKQSDEYKEKALELDIHEEYGIMSKGIMGAIQDSRKYFEDEESAYQCLSIPHRHDQLLHGAVIVCPVREEIISSSYDEMKTIIDNNSTNNHLDCHSYEDVKTLLWENPLNSPALFAIQGVSRKERLAATTLGMDNDSFKKNQYLCTGYDIYLTKEPSIFESMALVHARIRRVIFCESNEEGGLGGGLPETSIHLLPSTNHRYRAFQVIERDDSEVYVEFLKLKDLVKAFIVT